MENGIPVPAKGELLGASPASQWHGFPLEIRMMPAIDDVEDVYCPNPLIMMS